MKLDLALVLFALSPVCFHGQTSTSGPFEQGSYAFFYEGMSYQRPTLGKRSVEYPIMEPGAGRPAIISTSSY